MKIDWYGNNGYRFPKPGTVDKVNCGVCGAQMKVRRNVLGPISRAMAMAGKKRRHDSFACPHVKRNWHQKIYLLKIDVYFAEINDAANYHEKKKYAAKVIREILKKQAA